MERRLLSTGLVCLLALFIALLAVPGTVQADGTETLGPPSIPIADGTGMIAAGTGLINQPGTIDITVPDGVTVEQVLLYWSGGAEGVNNPGDDTLTIAGNSVTGTLIGGPLSDVLMKRDKRWGLWLGALSYAVSFPIMLAIFLTPSMTMAIALTFISFIIVGLPNGPLFAAVQSVVAPRMRALAAAVTMFSASVVGIGGGPFVVGILSDLMGKWAGDQSLRYALIVATLFILIPIVHFLLGARTLVRDQEAAKAER